MRREGGREGRGEREGGREGGREREGGRKEGLTLSQLDSLQF